MTSGFPKFGCNVQSSKTLSNLDEVDNAGGSSKSIIEEVSFCGALLNVVTKSARMDFTSYHGANIVHSITFQLWDSDTEERCGISTFLLILLQ